jgi:adenine nucleotide transporter 17
MTAMSVFYPLDTVRSRLQMEDNRKAKDTLNMLEELVREEGFESLYRGLQPVLTSLCASGFVYFYTFHGLRAVFSDGSQKHSAWRDLGLGALAGAINVLITTPMWVVNTRMKMQGVKLRQGDESLKKYPRYEGIFDGLQKIIQHEGIGTLWASTLPSLMLVSNPAIQFAIYEALKRRVMGILGTETLNAGTVFALGACSKSISTVITYPLQLVQSKSRYGSEDVKNKRLVEILMAIIERNGAGGLYKGLEAKLLQTVLTTALMYLCYEKITGFVFTLMKGQKKLA